MSRNDHPVPGRAALALEQLWFVGRAGRWVWVAGAVLLGFVTWLVSGTPGPETPPEFVPGMVSVFAAGLAGLLAQAIWHQEGPSRRAYFHSMPASRLLHQLLRTGAGWAWAVLCTAVLYVWGVAVIVPLADFRTVRLEPWQWASPFVATSIVFLFVAALTTLFDHGGAMVVPLYFLGMVLVRWEPGLRLIATGRYSLATAGSGSTLDLTLERWSAAAPPGDWLLASLFWLGAGALALYAASRFRRDA